MKSSRSSKVATEPRGLVYSYTRFSDPRQASGHSRDRQRAYAAKWAEEHGLELDESLSMEDKGLSAYHQHHVRHGALGAFLEAVAQGRVPQGSVLVVEGLDRLSRAEPLLAQGQLAQIINAGITVVTASDNRVYSREHLKKNPMELITSLVVMIRAHEESETKSQRVKAAIRKQCEGWIAGTFRGLIRNGSDPSWLKWAGDKWDLIPDRVQAVRLIVSLYRQGLGATRISAHLKDKGVSHTGRPIDVLQIYRLVRSPGLIGTRDFDIGGEKYTLEGYYPPVLTMEEWQDLQSIASRREIRQSRTGLPNLVTGLGITRCGYCGSAMIGQHIQARPRTDGKPPRSSSRRIMCSAGRRTGTCSHPASRSIVPIEQAIVSYCSDMLNLQALYQGDRTAGPRERLATARNELATVDRQLQRVADALMASDDPPAVFLQTARDLEGAKAKAIAAIAAAERDLAALARTDLQGVDEKWRAIAEGVINLNAEARAQARLLVADTFEQITVYLHSLRPTPCSDVYDVVLVAKGGASRVLRIDRDGNWVSGDEVEQSL